MDDKIFGEVMFKDGWFKDDSISLWGKDFNILVMATAYYENEPITKAQQESYSSFVSDKLSLLRTVEKLLSDFMNDPEKHLLPRFLVFEKNGNYALLFDDDRNPDDGIAVQLSPVEKVMSQDAYL